MINVKDLKKRYNQVTVLDIPELAIRSGETVGLVGNNGAGKTTFFRCILDLIRPETGNVILKGEPVQGNELWKNFSGSYLDENFLIDFLSPEEYFEFVGSLHRMSAGDMEEFTARMHDFFNDEILGKKKYIRDFSKGNQKKIGIAATLLGSPGLLILDEPFTNLDPSSQIRLKRLLVEANTQHGVTMFISSHDLSHVTEVCRRIIVLDKGKVVHDLQTNENTLAVLEQFFAV